VSDCGADDASFLPCRNEDSGWSSQSANPALIMEGGAAQQDRLDAARQAQPQSGEIHTDFIGRADQEKYARKEQ